MIKIIIADDHPLVREGLKKVLSRESDILIIGEAENADKLLTMMDNIDCDILLLDIVMPGKGGLELLRELVEKYPLIRIIMLTMHPEDHFAMRAYKNGAKGYLTKTTDFSEILKAIRLVSEGGTYVSHNLAEKIAFEMIKKDGKLLHEDLSVREYEVLCSIAKGLSMKKIAEKLNIRISTASTYRGRILKKMGMNSNAELIRYVLQNRLLEI